MCPELDDALAREQRLIDTNKTFAARIRALAAVIVELTEEAGTGKIVPFQQFLQSRTDPNSCCDRNDQRGGLSARQGR